jgi:hypothetical protein
MRDSVSRSGSVDPRILPPRNSEARYTHYTFDEEALIVSRLTCWTRPTIARHLGRTPRAIRGWCWRHGQNPRNQHLLTSGQAAKITGLSQQWLTEMARAGRIKARREPGGRWWLFSPAALERIKERL